MRRYVIRIKNGDIYYIDLYEEPKTIYEHKKTQNGKLDSTGCELIKAIISLGMPDVYLTSSAKKSRKDEIYFLISFNQKIFMCRK